MGGGKRKGRSYTWFRMSSRPIHPDDKCKDAGLIPKAVTNEA
jgi:hypothetical protein